MFSLIYLLSLELFTLLLSSGEVLGINRLENSINDINNNNGDIELNHNRLLLADPLTAALFATSVTQAVNFLTRDDCIELWNRWGGGACERVKIKINNHFCNIQLEKVDQKYDTLLEASAQNIISKGQGNSGGEFYGTLITKGLIRYKMNINGDIYLLDFFWCIDCEYNYYKNYEHNYNDYIHKDDLNGYGIAILPTYANMDIEESYNCYHTMFLKEHEPSKDGYEISVPSDCGHWKGSYGPVSIYTKLADTKTISFQSAGNGIGIKILSEMTEVSPYTLTLDVLPYNGIQADGAYCPK